MEGRDQDARCGPGIAPPEQGGEAMLHFVGRAPGEGKSQEAVRRNLAFRDLPGDPVRESPGLPGAGPGNNHQRAARSRGRPLFLIQAAEQRAVCCPRPKPVIAAVQPGRDVTGARHEAGAARADRPVAARAGQCAAARAGRRAAAVVRRGGPAGHLVPSGGVGLSRRGDGGRQIEKCVTVLQFPGLEQADPAILAVVAGCP